MTFNKERYLEIIKETDTKKQIGRVVEIIGLIIESDGPNASIGDLCYIYPNFDQAPVWAEVVGFRQNRILLMPLGSVDGIRPGSIVESTGGAMQIGVGKQLIGRVLDGLGRPIDTLGDVKIGDFRPTTADLINPLRRTRISEPLSLGIRSNHNFLSLSKSSILNMSEKEILSTPTSLSQLFICKRS